MGNQELFRIKELDWEYTPSVDEEVDEEENRVDWWFASALDREYWILVYYDQKIWNAEVRINDSAVHEKSFKSLDAAGNWCFRQHKKYLMSCLEKV